MQDRDLTELSFEIFNFKCFDESGSGVLQLAPINFVIGRNNAGKSAVVDFVDFFLSKGQKYDILKHGRSGVPTSFQLSQSLQTDDLQSIFRVNTSGGILGGNHWAIGSTLDNTMVTFLDGYGVARSIVKMENPSGLHQNVVDEAGRMILERIGWPLNGLGMTRVAAERDVQPEQMSSPQDIRSNGAGLTNAIACQITRP